MHFVWLNGLEVCRQQGKDNGNTCRTHTLDKVVTLKVK